MAANRSSGPLGVFVRRRRVVDLLEQVPDCLPGRPRADIRHPVSMAA